MKHLVFALPLALAVSPALADARADLNACSKATNERRSDDAIALCTKALEAKTLEGLEIRHAYSVRATAHAQKKDCAKAVLDFAAALAVDAKHFASYIGRAFCYMELKKYDEAAADYGKMIELQPKNPFHYVYRCQAYKAGGKKDAAIADCKKALEMNPNHAIAKRELEALGAQ